MMEPSPAIIRESVKHIKEWLEKDPHLPNVEDEDWLETYFYNNKFSLEKTKAKLALYYSIKNEYPEIMKKRDPTTPASARARKAMIVCYCRELTQNGYYLSYAKFGPDPDLFNTNDIYKRLTMMSDAQHLEKHRRFSFAAIVDCQFLSYKHVLKTVPTMPGMVNLVNAYTERIAEIHFISAPPFLRRSIELVKRYLPEKLSKRLFVHTAGSESIINTTDRKVLASDFGGDGPSLAELDEQCQKLLEKHRNWFLEQDNVCADGFQWKTDDMNGSFKRLDID
nr:PREDICTED: clavesin-2-like isoform X2 [Bemisia tabaci]